MSNPPSSVVFGLSPDFPIETGWTDAVRWHTTQNPEVIRHLSESASVRLGEDPATLLAQWWPSAGYMVYFQRVRAEIRELVVTDGVFTLSIPADDEVGGLGAFLFQRARSAWFAACPGCSDPFFPTTGGLPAAAIVHRLNSGEAHVTSFEAAIRAITHKESL